MCCHGDGCMILWVRLKTAESELAKVMAQLQEKQKALGEIEAKVMMALADYLSHSDCACMCLHVHVFLCNSSLLGELC